MEYPKEFVDLLRATQETMIGVGNPNAKILIIACEPSIDNDNQTEREIRKNKEQWSTILNDPRLMDEWVLSHNPAVNPCKDLEYGHPNYNPFYPYHMQKNSPMAKKGGTSRTWWYYQKIIDGIFKSTPKQHIDFHQKCFVTDLSAENAINQNQTIKIKTQLSIKNRTNEFFSHDFFQSFPIIIMCCGHYVRDYEVKPNELFNVPFWGEKQDVNREWINYHCIKGNKPKLLLHTKHLTARGLKANDYIAEIAKLCRQFKDENNIQL